jgi:apolipoprotein D and lipocalin family protein
MNEINGSSFFVFVAVSLLLLLAACNFKGGNSIPPLQVVNYVDLQRYVGRWYEIARYPHKFQEGCLQSQATYTLTDKGISVLNECYEEEQPEKLRSAEGKARVVDSQTNAKLKVSFFWPFYGKYWIIDLGEDYEYAVVGHPSRKYLWILSRTPEMDNALYQDILRRLQDQHYDTSKLIRTRKL